MTCRCGWIPHIPSIGRCTSQQLASCQTRGRWLVAPKHLNHSEAGTIWPSTYLLFGGTPEPWVLELYPPDSSFYLSSSYLPIFGCELKPFIPRDVPKQEELLRLGCSSPQFSVQLWSIPIHLAKRVRSNGNQLIVSNGYSNSSNLKSSYLKRNWFRAKKHKLPRWKKSTVWRTRPKKHCYALKKFS